MFSLSTAHAPIHSGAFRVRFACSLLAGLLTFGILWSLYIARGYAPYGELSLATMDCNIQYLDFFSYLKDVLTGKNSIAYSFSKVLGGTCVGLFSYYLASPFNLLLLLYDKADVVSFVDLLAALKFSFAAMTCAVFLNARLNDHERASLCSYGLAALLSVAYALGQYSISQASNIMWIDGVYMLPLMLLGVYVLVKTHNGVLLAIVTALSILFNWYTGGINCLFAILWFAFELLLHDLEQKPCRSLGAYAQRTGFHILRFGYSMLTGLLLSGLLFLPTIAAMRKSSEGSLDFFALSNLRFTGSILTLIEGYLPGATSTPSSVALYSGSLVILGVLSFFVNRQIAFRRKAVYLFLVLMVIMSLYWNPLYLTFSLFKMAYSYWCRFAYTGILALVYISASFFLQVRPATMTKPLCLSALLLAGIMALRCHTIHMDDTPALLRFGGFLLLTALPIILFSVISSRKSGNQSVYSSLCMLWLVAVFVIETRYSVGLQMDNYQIHNGISYAEYSQEAQQRIDALKKYDNGIYRISDIAIRDSRPDGLTAAYNEAMAYNYPSIAGYSSSPDARSSVFLDMIGYRSGDTDMNITNTSILAADSLLGVKYVLSDKLINGLVPVDTLPVSKSGKQVLNNPYALPLAFTYCSRYFREGSGENPFECLNRIYTVLLGSSTKIWFPLSYNAENGDSSVVFTVTLPEGNYAVYGNLPWNREYDGMLDLNGMDRTAYAKWLSPSVFYIPTESGAAECKVSLTANRQPNWNAEFYALDLDRFSEVTALLRSRKADVIDIKNGSAYIEAVGDKDHTDLFVSIPYDSGWTVIRNGEQIEPHLFEGCLYSIPLKEGPNQISFTYHIEYGAAGIVSTIIGITMIILMMWVGARKSATSEGITSFLTSNKTTRPSRSR